MMKYFQLSRIQRAVERAWYDDGVCTGRSSDNDCVLNARDDLPALPTTITDTFDNILAKRMVDYVARIELDSVPLPPGHTEVDRYNPRVGPSFGVAWLTGTTMILAFRATHTHQEIQDDLMAWQVHWETGERVEIPLPDSHDQVNIAGLGAYVHSGFYSVFNRFADAVVDTIRRHSPTTVLVCGHSLGGAVSTLMTLRIAELRETGALSIGALACYCFGTPRVGNSTFDTRLRASEYIDSFWRVVNEADDIQKLPLRVTPNFKRPSESPFYYEHAGDEYSYLDSWGTWRTNHFLPNYMYHLYNT